MVSFIVSLIFLFSYRVSTSFDDIEKHKKLEKCEKSQITGKFQNPKSYASLNINDGLGNFEEINMVIVEPKSSKLDKPILQRVQPGPPCSFRDHFYPPPELPHDHVLTSLLSLRM